MAEKPDMSFLNKAVDYTIKRIKEAGEKVDSKELKGAMRYESVLSFVFACGAQWRKDTNPNKSDYIKILDSVLNEYIETIEKEKKAEEERQKRLKQRREKYNAEREKRLLRQSGKWEYRIGIYPEFEPFLLIARLCNCAFKEWNGSGSKDRNDFNDKVQTIGAQYGIDLVDDIWLNSDEGKSFLKLVPYTYSIEFPRKMTHPESYDFGGVGDHPIALCKLGDPVKKEYPPYTFTERTIDILGFVRVFPYGFSYILADTKPDYSLCGAYSIRSSYRSNPISIDKFEEILFKDFGIKEAR